MPVSMQELQAHLAARGCKADVAGDLHLVVGAKTAHYLDSDGDKHVFMHIMADDDGGYVRVFVQDCYSLHDCKHKCATLAVLTEICSRRRSVQCGYDPNDGEVTYSVDAWVKDGTLTQHQLFSMIRQLLSTLEDCDPVVRHAMETGEVKFELLANDDDPSDGADGEGMSAELAALLEQVGGIEGLRAIVEERTRQDGRPAN